MWFYTHVQLCRSWQTYQALRQLTRYPVVGSFVICQNSLLLVPHSSANTIGSRYFFKVVDSMLQNMNICQEQVIGIEMILIFVYWFVCFLFLVIGIAMIRLDQILKLTNLYSTILIRCPQLWEGNAGLSIYLQYRSSYETYGNGMCIFNMPMKPIDVPKVLVFLKFVDIVSFSFYMLSWNIFSFMC